MPYDYEGQTERDAQAYWDKLDKLRKEGKLKPHKPFPLPILTWEKLNPVTWHYLYGGVNMHSITLTAKGYRVSRVHLLKGKLSHITRYYATLALAKAWAEKTTKENLLSQGRHFKEK